MKKIDELLKSIIEYNQGDPMRIQHLIKVHSLSSLLGKMENLDTETQFILESAALVHDIGVRNAEKEHGDKFKAYHENIGIVESENLLNQLSNYTDAQIQRIKYIVGNHHHYNKIDKIDFQILVEADFMVNAFEKQLSLSSIDSFKEKICKTESGAEILSKMFYK